VKSPDERVHYLCGNCSLIFTDKRFFPSAAEERGHYILHENSIQHNGYVSFLNRAIQPALPYLKPGIQGLDYGCGPTPTLCLLLQQAGYKTDHYDPYFFPELDKDSKYDFIFATECFEHFFAPANEVERLGGLLKAGGILVVMTEWWKDIASFKDWYYARDPTHVVFYHSHTFDYICSRFGFKTLYSDGSRVIILQKKVSEATKDHIAKDAHMDSPAEIIA
jgi:SAM-dependent methyltransferase